ncbi:HAD-IIB family hydrolase [Frondihabitans cladoniiphilus]|uniref:phosphomannomutase n=1 Tax=Frondihabitans cladoniiphilus TaxID=715785 RepID=A0ABP8VWH4_9MICO
MTGTTSQQPFAWQDAPTTLPAMIAFDLDDTLAPSKTALSDEMAELLVELLRHVDVCIISGGQIEQFRMQVVNRLPEDAEAFTRLHLMPTCGTQYWRFDDGAWVQRYATNLTDQQITDAFEIIERTARELGYWESDTWGPILENRGSQVTFSALGQEAPVDEKKKWDPTGSKKEALRAAIAPQLPDLEVRSGGSTSIDVTLQGVDKAYGMRQLERETGIAFEKTIFVGDRLDEGGNDYPVLVLPLTGVKVDGPDETAAYLRVLLAD